MNSCLILAAGNGSRMKLKCPKVLAQVLNVPMLSWVLDSVIDCGINNKCVVTGYGSAKVKKFLKSNNYNCETVFQAERKGTAHAVMTLTTSPCLHLRVPRRSTTSFSARWNLNCLTRKRGAQASPKRPCSARSSS